MSVVQNSVVDRAVLINRDILTAHYISLKLSAILYKPEIMPHLVRLLQSVVSLCLHTLEENMEPLRGSVIHKSMRCA